MDDGERGESAEDARGGAGEARPSIDLKPIAQLVVERFGAAPCASVAAAIRRGNSWHYGAGAFGVLWREGPGAPPEATSATPFDLASVTKPLTALALARLERRGALSRGETVGDVIPALARSASARVPIELFAAHRAGLEAHRALFASLMEEGRSIDAATAIAIAADARRPECTGEPPREGFAPVYSDLGYLVLGATLAARGGELPADIAFADATALEDVVAMEVTRPLGLRVGTARWWRSVDASFDERVAPTEIVPWRGGLVRGVVHDENAWVVAGDSQAGHAGLFGDAISVARLGVAVLDALAGRATDWLRSDELAPLVTDRPGGSLLAGFDRRSGDAPSSGQRFGPRTFGHLGFTGTSLWMDPDRELAGVLLTNRVHPSRASDAIRRARPAAYDAIADAMIGLLK